MHVAASRRNRAPPRLPFPLPWRAPEPFAPTSSTQPASRHWGESRLSPAGSSTASCAGLHRSPRKGFSVEFAEYRPYQPGDDLALHRLEDRRALRSLGRSPVRGGNQPPRQHRARRQPVDGVERHAAPARLGGSRDRATATVAERHEARIRRAVDCRARAPAAAPARRRRSRAFRRPDSNVDPAARAQRPMAPRHRVARGAGSRARIERRPTRCTRPRV